MASMPNLSEGSGAAAEAESIALLLPKEVTRRIFMQLDPRDLLCTSQTCKQWWTHTEEFRQGWKEELLGLAEESNYAPD
eukprot:CAMPEP_0118956602 /NCGR_PEP_ID=MMETSP1169-20130426/61667_1 /TAXON_ID=36882 /ORGANISM="Pyramimonas obovata, Strain CCMP722" /LENGTH=78 /DNA_ID=CAMNT_0006904639 /DNA_START=116 /DNA_END=352 /DNA_ORIENTATION=+